MQKESQNSRKIFCIGFQKTGTSSMRDALRMLGYSVTGSFHGSMPLDQMRDSFVKVGLEKAAQYDAVEDMPWPLMFRELDAEFPNAAFILTIRNSDNWLKSITGHFGDKRDDIQRLTYGDDAPAPLGHEEHYRSVYEAHNKAVIEHFRDRPDDLLVMDLEAGDGWDELGRFLGREDVPTGPFFHVNSARERTSLLNRIRSKLRGMGLPARNIAE
ncbi:MAG: sulfotransferase [Pseudomonadota bacterium]|nr:sulfotransferase [Pseudomonadota bacterium]